MYTRILLALTLLLCVACSGSVVAESEARSSNAASTTEVATTSGDLAVATFAGGCFWCMEPPFDKLDGVVSTTSGYIDGHVDNPTYKQVSSGGSGHTEAVEIRFDPEQITYEELLRVFWRNIDPTVADRQFCDYGDQYRTGIFFHDDEQKRLAEASRQALLDADAVERIVTEIVPATKFYAAEDYHQDFYKKNPGRYKSYRQGCGRDRRLRELWGDSAAP